jgi:hypothetical protein
MTFSEDRLRFEGFVTAGIGRHSELGIPGRADVATAPTDWPERLFPGSLNVRITAYPKAFAQHRLPETIRSLDSGLFVPTFEVRRDEIRNNRLSPTDAVPRRGDAQVWRATIETTDAMICASCWALRRFGSQVGEQLELVADIRLRDLGLDDERRVVVAVFGSWR